jgi:outer membrane protein OmpA-like peptidoglycan-associated protein
MRSVAAGGEARIPSRLEEYAMRYPLKGLALVATLGAATLAMGGCATEDYVDQHIATVNTRIDQTNAKVDSVNGKVDALSGRVDGVDTAAKAAHARADAAYTLAQGKLLMSEVSREMVNFDTNKWALSTEAKATLTALAEKLKADNKNVFIELIGHADTRGPELRNRVLGEKRAIEVRHFLFDQGIPLNAMQTVSWGDTRPKAEGETAAAHASNRRVEVIVLQ